MISTDILSTGDIAARTLAATGDAGAAAAAAGWSAWILSITGSVPTATVTGNKVSVTLSTEQTVKLRRYLTNQVKGSMKAKEEPVSLNLDKSIGPWALQYSVPLILLAFVAGWYGHSLRKRR